MTAHYTGAFDHLCIYEPQNPVVWQDTLRFAWDQRRAFHLTGRDTVKKEPPQVRISGHVTKSKFIVFKFEN